MSTLIVDELAGRKDNNHNISFPNNSTFYAPGHVIQTVWRKMDYHNTVTAANDNVSRDIGLATTITLKRANSLVYIQFYLFYETHHNVVFNAKRGGSVIGYNTEVGNTRWSGIGVADYEHTFDFSSTPSYSHMCYVDTPGSVGPHTYELGVKGSGGSNFDVRINRSWSSFSDSYESGVSWCIIEEIAQ
jgi:hypothetical protein